MFLRNEVRPLLRRRIIPHIAPPYQFRAQAPRASVLQLFASTTTSRHASNTPKTNQAPATNGSSAPNDPLASCLSSNQAWASQISSSDPSFFQNLSKGQSPKILWLGCSDSRVPETTLLNLRPGDVFTHRNIANILPPTDLSSLSVIEFAVVYLKVEHIVVCGHTSCGGVAASLGNKRLGKIDTWLTPLRALRLENAEKLEQAKKEGGDAAANRLLVDLNVQKGVQTVRQNADVIQAAQDRGLTVQGLVFDLTCGELKRVDTGEDDGAVKSRNEAFGCA